MTKTLPKYIAKEAVAESELILMQHNKYNIKNTTHIYKENLNYLHQHFHVCRKYQSKHLLILDLYHFHNYDPINDHIDNTGKI